MPDYFDRLEELKSRFGFNVPVPQTAPRYDANSGEGEHVVLPGESWPLIAERQYGSQDPYLVRLMQASNPGSGRLHPGMRLKLPSRPGWLPTPEIQAGGDFDEYLDFLNQQQELIDRANVVDAQFTQLSTVSRTELEFGQPVYLGLDDDGNSFLTADEAGAPLYVQQGERAADAPTVGFVGLPEEWGLAAVSEDNSGQLLAGISPDAIADPAKYMRSIYKENPELRQAHAFAPVDPLKFIVDHERAQYDAELEAYRQEQIDLTLAGEQRLQRAEIAANEGYIPEDPTLRRALGVEGDFIDEAPLGQRQEDGSRRFFLTIRDVPRTFTTQPSGGLHQVARYGGQVFDERIRGTVGWALANYGSSEALSQLIGLSSLGVKLIGGETRAIAETVIGTLSAPREERYAATQEKSVAMRTDTWDRVPEADVDALRAQGVDIQMVTPFDFVLIDVLDEWIDVKELSEGTWNYSYSLAYMNERGMLTEEELETLESVGFDFDIIDVGDADFDDTSEDRQFYQDRYNQLREDALNAFDQQDYSRAETLMMAAHDDRARAGRVGYNPFWQPTWVMRSDLEVDFRRAVAQAELQAGEELTDSEVLQIRNQFMDGATEFIPQIVDASAAIAPVAKGVLGLGKKVAPSLLQHADDAFRAVRNVPPQTIGHTFDIPGYLDTAIHAIRQEAVQSSANKLQSEVARIGNEMAQGFDFAVPVRVQVGDEFVDVIGGTDTLGYWWKKIGDTIASGRSATTLADEVPAFLRPHLSRFDELAKVYDPFNYNRTFDDMLRAVETGADRNNLPTEAQRLLYKLEQAGYKGDDLIEVLQRVDEVMTADEAFLRQGSRVIPGIVKDFDLLPSKIRGAVRTFARHYDTAPGFKMEAINPSRWGELPRRVYNQTFDYLKNLEQGRLLRTSPEAIRQRSLIASLPEGSVELSAAQDTLQLIEAKIAKEASEFALRQANKPGVIAPRVGGVFAEALRSKHTGIMNPSKMNDAIIETVARVFGWSNRIEDLRGPVRQYLEQLHDGRLSFENLKTSDVLARLHLADTPANRRVVSELVQGHINPVRMSVFELAKELGVSTQAGVSRRFFGTLERGANKLVKGWIYSVLHYSPRWTARNIMDSNVRAHVAGATMSDDINTVIRRLKIADALPEDVLDAFGRQYDSKGLSFIQELLVEPDADFSIPGVVGRWLKRREFENPLTTIRQWREEGSSLRNLLSSVGKPLVSFKDGVAGLNTLTEVTLRLRGVDHHYFSALDKLSPRVLDQLLERLGQRYGLGDDDIRLLRTVWNRSGGNAAVLEDYLNTLLKKGGRRVPAAHSLVLPSNFAELASEFGLDRQTARILQQDLDAALSVAIENNSGALRKAYAASKAEGDELLGEIVDGVISEFRREYLASFRARALEAGDTINRADEFVPTFEVALEADEVRGLRQLIRTGGSSDALKNVDQDFVDILQAARDELPASILDSDELLDGWLREEFSEFVKSKEAGERFAARAQEQLLEGWGADELGLRTAPVDVNQRVVNLPPEHLREWRNVQNTLAKLTDEQVTIASTLDELRTATALDQLPSVKPGHTRIYQGLAPGNTGSSSWTVSPEIARGFAGPRGRVFTAVVDRKMFEAGKAAAEAEGVLPAAARIGDELRIRGLSGDLVQTAEDVARLEAAAAYLEDATSKINDLRARLRAFTLRVFPGPTLNLPAPSQQVSNTAWDIWFSLSERIMKQTNRMLDEAVLYTRTADEVVSEYTAKPIVELLEDVGIVAEISPEGILNRLELQNAAGTKVWGYTTSGPLPRSYADSLIEAFAGPGIPPSQRWRVLNSVFGDGTIDDVLGELGQDAQTLEDAVRFVQYDWQAAEGFDTVAAANLSRTLPDGTRIRFQNVHLPESNVLLSRGVARKVGGELRIVDEAGEIITSLEVGTPDAAAVLLGGRLQVEGISKNVADALKTLDDEVFLAQARAPWYATGQSWSDLFSGSVLTDRRTFIRYLDNQIEFLSRQELPRESIDVLRFLRRHVAAGGEAVAREAAGFGVQMPRLRTASNLEYLPGRLPEHQLTWLSQQLRFLAEGGNVSDFLRGRDVPGNLLNTLHQMIDDGLLFLDTTNVNVKALQQSIPDLVQSMTAIRNVALYGTEAGLEGLKFSKALDFVTDPRAGAPTRFTRLLDAATDVGESVTGIPSKDALVGSMDDALRRIVWEELGTLDAAAYPGAVSLVQNAMLEYGRFSRGDQLAKTVIPFWQFFSRTAVRDLELMVKSPRMFYFYSKYRHMSQLSAQREGFVDSKGRAARRTSGTMRIPGTNIWIDPFQSMSIRALMPNRLESVERSISDKPLGDVIAGMLYDVAGPIGVSIAPWWNEVLYQVGVLDENEYPRRSLVPFTDVFIPPWDQRTIQGAIPASLAEAFGIAQNPADPRTWGSDMPWKSYMIEEQITIATLQRLSETDDQSELDKIVADYLAALGYIAQLDDEGNPIDYDMQMVPEHPLYQQALREVEARAFYPSRFGHYTGLYGKVITDEDADLWQRRLRINELRDAINNAYGAHVIMLDPTPEERYEEYNELRYNTPEQYVLRTFSDSAWVQTPDGERAYGEEKKQLFGQAIYTQQVTQAYWDARQLALDNLSAALQRPVGARARADAFEEYFAAIERIENAPMYAVAERPENALFIGNKPSSIIFNKAQAAFYSAVDEVYKSMQWRKDQGEDYSAFELRQQNFQEIDFETMRRGAEGIIEQNIRAGITEATIAKNAEELGLPEDATLDDVLEVSGGKLVLFDGRTLNIPELVSKAAAGISWDGYIQFDRSNNTPLQALNEAWMELGQLNEFYALQAELKASGANAQERRTAEELFLEKFGEGPEVDEVIDWVLENYPEGQFTEEQLEEVIRQAQMYSLGERLEDQPVADALIGQVFDELANIPPGFRRGEFNDAFEALGGDLDLLNRWFDPVYRAGVQAAVEEGDDEQFAKLLQDIQSTFENLGWKAPSTEQRAVWGQVQRDNTRFEQRQDAMLAEAYGQDWRARLDIYWDANTSQRKAMIRQDRSILDIQNDYYRTRCLYAEENPRWAEFYMSQAALDRCKKGRGSAGASRSFTRRRGGGGGRGRQQVGDAWIPWGYRAVPFGVPSQRRLGAGGVAGKPTWPPGFFGRSTPSGVFRDLIAQAEEHEETGQPVELPERTVNFIAKRLEHIGVGNYADENTYKRWSEWVQSVLDGKPKPVGGGGGSQPL